MPWAVCPGLCHVRGRDVLITRGDGLIDRDQAAELAGVTPDAVTIWATRGYMSRDGKTRCWLPVAKREGRKPLYSPVEVQKAEWHTRRRGRREIRPAQEAPATRQAA